MKEEDNDALGSFNIQFGSFTLEEGKEEEEEALQCEGNYAVSKLDSMPPAASPPPVWAALFKQPNVSDSTEDKEQRKDLECPSSLRPTSISNEMPVPTNKSVLSGEGRPASDVIHCKADGEKNASIDELIRDALVQLHMHPSIETSAKLVRRRDFLQLIWIGSHSCWNGYVSSSSATTE